jgi:hypothetical protein
MPWRKFINARPPSLIEWTGLHTSIAQPFIEDLLREIPVPDDEVVAARLVRGAATVVMRAVLWSLEDERKADWKEQKGGSPAEKGKSWTAEELLAEAPVDDER